MAENARLEDLRKRYHENPRRFFAPLANEYRKAGFLDRAVLLCEKHLAEQPENMNGLVVYGQTLFDSGRLDDARAPFEQALGVDPENLIALRHLGDIARLGGDQPAARAWYEKVLELDRRNDEVIDLLEQLDAGAPAPPTSAPATPGGKGSTVVIDAQAMADQDRREASPEMSFGTEIELPSEPPAASAPAVPEVPPARASAPAEPAKETANLAAEPPTAESGLLDLELSEDFGGAAPPAEPPAAPPAAATVETPAAAAAPAPKKRTSLLDIDFDFSDIPEAPAAAPLPDVPMLGADAAEYGVGEMPPVTNAAEPATEAEPALADFADELAVEASPEGESLAPTTVSAEAESSAAEPAPPPGDFELADFSADVAPMAGLESMEFEGGEAAPLDGLEAPGADVQATAEPEAPELPTPAPTDAAGMLSDLPPLDEQASAPSEPSRKPRMTKADLASLPLLADFGLEDDAPAETPAAPAPVRPSKATPTFVTETMAELYVKQGFTEEAIAVYRQLIKQSPSDESLRRKLAALEQDEQGMPEFEAPDADAEEPTPAPPTAALDEVSFAGVGLATPTPTNSPLVTPAPSGGPTAREFLAGFARRAATPAAADHAADAAGADGAAPIEEPPTAVPSSAWPLDALFGAPNDVRDLSAAEMLAGVGTFEGPDGGSGLDELLAEGSSAPRRSVPRASQSLKFDQFFQPTAPIEENLPEMPSADPEDDDLDQFNDWLKGLKPQG